MTDARFTLTIGNLQLAQAEILAQQLDDSLNTLPLAVSINETSEIPSIWEVVGYYADEAEANRASTIAAGQPASVLPIPDVDWVRKSLEGLAPVVAGRFYLYGSHDRDRARAGGISLEIDAGTAFGTGHHQTTRGCLMAFDRAAKGTSFRRTFDLGCGTGVLAIAAAKLGKTRALATDIDPEAVRVTRNNAGLNGVGPLIRAVIAPGLHHPVIRSSGPFDLVFANILARPLASLAPGLASLVAPGGYLLLSGITREQVRWITACYRNRGLITAWTYYDGNWATAVLTRRHKRKSLRRHRLRQLAGQGPGWEEA